MDIERKFRERECFSTFFSQSSTAGIKSENPAVTAVYYKIRQFKLQE
jgi:hypothetical protein